jgi:hypothetical protein
MPSPQAGQNATLPPFYAVRWPRWTGLEQAFKGKESKATGKLLVALERNIRRALRLAAIPAGVRPSRRTRPGAMAGNQF